jgi:hypothetical protein
MLTAQDFYMKEISFMDFPQYGEVFYFYGQALVYKLHRKKAFTNQLELNFY